MNTQCSPHVYEVRPRSDKRRVDLISDVLPFGRLCYLKYAKHEGSKFIFESANSYLTTANNFSYDPTRIDVCGLLRPGR